MVGSVVAGHRIERLVGKGGMGVVYEATELALERPVALKVISPELANDVTFRRRFIAESKRAAAIDHPNVIPVYRADKAADVLFQTMRLVVGEDLRSVIVREGALDPARVARITLQVAGALDAAHARGVVHRDVKPANVLLAEGDHVYLTDFGLSKRTGGHDESSVSTGLVGTLNYIAPEQIRGAPVDARTDVYGLGCVVFKMLTDSVPFDVETEEAKMWAHLSTPPPALDELRPGLPAGLGEAVAAALRKEPDQRPASAGEFARAIADAVGGPAEATVGRSMQPAPAEAAEASISTPTSAPSGTGYGGMEPGVPADPAQRLVAARDAAREIDESARRVGIADGDVATELDLFQETLERAYAGAQVDYQQLRGQPPDELRRRLSAELSRADAGSRKLVAELKDKLLARQGAAVALERFNDSIDRALIELGAIDGLMVPGLPEPDPTARVHRRLRALRGELETVIGDCERARLSASERSSILERIQADD